MSMADRIAAKLGEVSGPIDSTRSIVASYGPWSNSNLRNTPERDAREIVKMLGPIVRVLEQMLLLAEKEEAGGALTTSDTQAKILAAVEKLAAGDDGPRILATLERIDWALRNRSDMTKPKDTP